MSDETTKPKLVSLMPPDEDIAVQKPGAFDLDKFKSKTTPAVAGVETLLTALPHRSLSQAKDFVRLHSDDDYWSPELCFVTVPIKGQKNDTLHLIDEDLAATLLASAPKCNGSDWRSPPSRMTCSFCVMSPVAISTTSGTLATCRRASRLEGSGRRPLSRKEEGVGNVQDRYLARP